MSTTIWRIYTIFQNLRKHNYDEQEVLVVVEVEVVLLIVSQVGAAAEAVLLVQRTHVDPIRGIVIVVAQGKCRHRRRQPGLPHSHLQE